VIAMPVEWIDKFSATGYQIGDFFALSPSSQHA
jgi:hypothetical protein